MIDHPTRASEPSEAIAELARIQLAGERRLQRLEKLFRWNLALLLSTLLLAAFALAQFLSVAPAQHAWPHVAPQLMPDPRAPSEPLPDPLVVAPAVSESPPPAVVEFNAHIEALRARIAKADPEQANPFQTIAVVLQDLREVLHETQQALAVMPEMMQAMQDMRGDIGHIATTMDSMDAKMAGVPAMAEEMRRLNINIDIMTTSIDSTMGRMGRMMPYMW